MVIGAFAAIAQGAPLEATHDVDVTPRPDTENLRRLSVALTELDARIRFDDLDEGCFRFCGLRSAARDSYRSRTV
jgi:hypothetical protein